MKSLFKKIEIISQYRERQYCWKNWPSVSRKFINKTLKHENGVECQKCCNMLLHIC